MKALEKGFALPDAGWSIEVTAKTTDDVKARGVKVEKESSRSFKVTALAGIPMPTLGVRPADGASPEDRRTQ